MKIVKNIPKTTYIKDKAPNLEELQDMVGGIIQVIQLKDKQIIVDEEGKLKGKEFNPEATELLALGKKINGYHTQWSAGYDLIVGDAVVLSDKAVLK
tara:strand:+ start:210 stop:500 length:291 start_codon:yes stop_codon:yes gene_type:complete